MEKEYKLQRSVWICSVEAVHFSGQLIKNIRSDGIISGYWSNLFQTKVSVRLWSMTSPWMFNMYMAKIIKAVKTRLLEMAMDMVGMEKNTTDIYIIGAIMQPSCSNIRSPPINKIVLCMWP